MFQISKKLQDVRKVNKSLVSEDYSGTSDEYFHSTESKYEYRIMLIWYMTLRHWVISL
jgi:hypothetical protein